MPYTYTAVFLSISQNFTSNETDDFIKSTWKSLQSPDSEHQWRERAPCVNLCSHSRNLRGMDMRPRRQTGSLLPLRPRGDRVRRNKLLKQERGCAMKLTATDYIARVDEIISMATEGKLPVQVGILAGSLRNLRPDDNPQADPAPGHEFMSSSDIRDRLAEVCDLELNEIAEVMTALGYRVYITPFNDAQWAIKDKEAD